MFTFLNPVFLVGLFAAAIPLIIHLSRSRRTKKIRFSTTRFLTDQFLKSYRMSRLKELLLLAARMALCALFAIALAEPFMQSSGRSLLDTSQPRTVVLVLDNSASMGYLENEVTLLDRARAAARELVDGLKDGDRASIVLASRRETGPEVLFVEPTPELGDVLQALEQLEVSGLGTDLARAVRKAEQLVRDGSAESSREIYVFSDLQDTGWEVPERNDDAPVDRESNVFVVSVRPEKPANLAVTAVQFAASRPMVGVPFAIRPHVLNQTGNVAAANVELHVDDKKVGEQKVESMQSGRWSVPVFHHTFDQGGWHSGYVQLSNDPLAADNRRYFAFEVIESVKVLAVNGAPSAVSRLDELFFLKAAFGGRNPGGKSPVQLDVSPLANLATTDLDSYSLVILANAEWIPAAAVERLEAWVDQGGSLLVFLGDKTDPAFHNKNLTGSNRLHGGLLSGQIIGREGDPTVETEPAHVGEIDANHVILSAFDQGVAGNLAGVTFKALWRFQPDQMSVLMRTSTGLPLLCERSFGQGQVMLFTSTCDRDWTNFPVRPVFLPWLYRTVGYLSQKPMAHGNYYATGDAVPSPVSATSGPETLLIRKPDGSVGNPVSSVNAAKSAFYDTEQSGVYRRYAPDAEDDAEVFVANLDAFESDMTYLDDVFAGDTTYAADGAKPQIAAERGFREVLLPGRPFVSFVSKPEELAAVSSSIGRGFRLWHIVLLIALAVALFEPWFANRISLQHYLKPREISTTPVMPQGRLRGALAGGLKPSATQPSAAESTSTHHAERTT